MDKDGLIGLLFILFLVLVKSRRMRKTWKKVNVRRTAGAGTDPGTAEGNREATATGTVAAAETETPVRGTGSLRYALSETAVRDDPDDWLSNQLKEEKRSLKRMSEMFELKMSHQADCSAEKLRREFRSAKGSELPFGIRKAGGTGRERHFLKK